MQIVIELNEKDYTEIMYNKEHSFRNLEWGERIIANGIPLPKGHGRLIDIDTDESYMVMRRYVSGSNISDMVDEMSLVLDEDKENI